MVLVSQKSRDLSYKKVIVFFHNFYQEKEDKRLGGRGANQAFLLPLVDLMPRCHVKIKVTSPPLVSIDTYTDCLMLTEEGREAPRLGNRIL